MKKIRKEVSRCTSWVEFSELRELFSVAVISWTQSDSKILLLELTRASTFSQTMGELRIPFMVLTKNFDGKQVKSRHTYF